jgi:hypothetical protein
VCAPVVPGPALPGPSDFEQLCFLALEQLVDAVHVRLGEAVQFLFGAGALILAGLAVLDQLVEGFLGLAADVADGDLGVLALGLDDLDVFLAAFLGQFRNGDSDDIAVVGRVGADFGVAERPFNVAQGGLVERGDEDGPGVRDGERGELLQRGGGTLVFHQDLVVKSGVCAAGTDGSEVFLGYLNGLVHLFFGFEQGFFDHGLS